MDDEAAAAGPTRFCPACYARNEWGSARCASCGADLAADESFDERLVWALQHPDTQRAERAAAALAVRRPMSALDALIELLGAPDGHRAAAGAAALVAYRGIPRADAAIASARRHRSVLVRRAVEQALDARRAAAQ